MAADAAEYEHILYERRDYYDPETGAFNPDGEGDTLAKLTNIYCGYSVTWYGGFVGLFWGFIDGAVAGAVLAWVYNKIVDRGAASS